MARLVKHTAHGPVTIKPQSDQISICRCGLTSSSGGLCDGSHNQTLDEKPGKIYRYDKKLNRQEIKDLKT